MSPWWRANTCYLELSRMSDRSDIKVTSRLFLAGLINRTINRALIGRKTHVPFVWKLLPIYISNSELYVIRMWAVAPVTTGFCAPWSQGGNRRFFFRAKKSPHTRAPDAVSQLDLFTPNCVACVPTAAENHFFLPSRWKGEPSNGSCQPSLNEGSKKIAVG